MTRRRWPGCASSPATAVSGARLTRAGPGARLSGTLEDWDRSGDLPRIDVPALVIGAAHDTMDPSHLRWMAEQLPQGRYLHCPDGSHLSQFDDPGHYFPGLADFLTSL
jgi:proline iminopeptidase